MKPCITIITATYNVQESFLSTANSIRVLKKNNNFVKWFLVDGDSIDKTKNLINDNIDIIDLFISEKDSGVYDAWNKVIKYVETDWILFIGSGDVLCIDNLCGIVEALHDAKPTHLLAYGNVEYLSSKKNNIVERSGDRWENYVNRWVNFLPMLPPHPSIFHHVSIFREKRLKFDTSFKYAADQLLLLQIIVDCPPLYLDFMIDKILIGGMTGRIESLLMVQKEFKIIAKMLGLRCPIKHLIFCNLALIIRRFLIFLLPIRSVYWVANCIRVLTGRNAKWD